MSSARTTAFLAVLVMAALSLSAAAAALSVAPASIVFDTPGRHEFTVIAHNEGEAGIISVRAEGDLADRISFDAPVPEFNGDAVIRGVIDVPEGLVPGDHSQTLLVSVTGPAEGIVGASVEVATLLVVRQQYSGPYLVAEVYAAPDNGVLDTTNLHIALENRGDAAIAPLVTLLRDGGREELQTREIAAGSVERFTAVLHGRGEERITLVVEGAQPLAKEFSAAVGHPLIVSLQAEAIPEPGNITPVLVTAEVSWNRPVAGTLIIDGKEHPIVIDGKLKETFYAETNATTFPVVLIVGNERLIADATTTASIAVQESRTDQRLLVLVIALLLAVILLLAFLLRYRRRPRAPDSTRSDDGNAPDAMVPDPAGQAAKRSEAIDGNSEDRTSADETGINDDPLRGNVGKV